MSFSNIINNAVAQVQAFFDTQLQNALTSLNNYDEHVNHAVELKQHDCDEHCKDAIEDLKFQLNECENDFNNKVNKRIEESRKCLKEKQNELNLLDGNEISKFHSEVQELISNTQNSMLERVANLHNELDLDDNFLNGYGKFHASNHNDAEKAQNNENCDCENCDCENCDCEDCDCCDEPEAPETPEEPEEPEEPEAPEELEAPEAPEEPETPEEPEAPEAPEEPEAPETPETPEAPEAPEAPETPEEVSEKKE